MAGLTQAGRVRAAPQLLSRRCGAVRASPLGGLTGLHPSCHRLSGLPAVQRRRRIGLGRRAAAAAFSLRNLVRVSFASSSRPGGEWVQRSQGRGIFRSAAGDAPAFACVRAGRPPARYS
jgi:hypothetical protein